MAGTRLGHGGTPYWVWWRCRAIKTSETIVAGTALVAAEVHSDDMGTW